MSMKTMAERYAWRLSFCRGNGFMVTRGLSDFRRWLWEDIRWALLRRVPRRIMYWCVMQALATTSVTTCSSVELGKIRATQVVDTYSPSTQRSNVG